MVIMAHARAKGQGQRSLRSKVKVETVGQTDGGDCITSCADAVVNENKKATKRRRGWATSLYRYT